MNHRAVKQADDQFYKNHPELVDKATGVRTPLTMSDKDKKLRQEWMRDYKTADEASKKGFSVCAAGGVLVACPKIPKECAYLDKPYTVESSKANFDRIRKPATLGEPKETTYKFPGDDDEQDALEYEVDVDGRKKKLIMPKNAPDEKSLPTAQQLADAMGTVPGPQLDKITQVVASPNPNPDDEYWAKEYKIPDFSSAATGGTSGVTFYPQDNWSQEFTDSTIIHEGGHSYSKDLWSDDDKKKAWKKATTDDGRSPSKYADSSTDEDFSESLVMYSLSKGTACEKTAKQLYPNRYQALDDLFGIKAP
jgi:hypothetical protein